MAHGARKGLFLTWAKPTTNQFGKPIHNNNSRWGEQTEAAAKPMTADVAANVVPLWRSFLVP